MLFRVFTLPFEPATERFNDAPVRDYLADKEVASTSDHFFTQDGRSYLAVVVRCHGLRTVGEAAAAPKADARRRRDESWRDELKPEAMGTSLVIVASNPRSV